MTAKQRSFQISLLRRLHTSPRYKHLYADDPIAYRAFLKMQLGVDSAKDLSLDTLIALTEYLEMKRDEPPTNYASSQQIGYLRHLWQDHSFMKDDYSLMHFCQRILKRKVDDFETLAPQEAPRMIAAVKALKKRSQANNLTYQGTQDPR